MELDFSLCLPRDEVSVPVVRHLCGFALRRLGVDDDCVGDIELAVTEACSNVLRHTAGTTDQYEVHVTIDECVCAISVVDTGAGFDHESLSAADAAPTAEGGRGIHLMRALVDDIRFVSKPESGTIVHLEKTLECDERSLLRRLAETRVGDRAAAPAG
ncbi:MAG TPA: ATP-binding protein [Actinomycetota bacterium]|nr:ATP-binding protein [Actinomycetota bacterium]